MNGLVLPRDSTPGPSAPAVLLRGSLRDSVSGRTLTDVVSADRYTSARTYTLRKANDLPETKEPYGRSAEAIEREARIGRIQQHYDTLIHCASAAHAPEFLHVAVTMAQAKVLYLLMTGGPFRVSELAARLGVSAPTTSQLVERLVEQGFAARAADRIDRRQVVVTATADGVAQLEHFRELGGRELRNILGYVSDADLPDVERVAGILNEASAAAVAAAAPPPAAPPPAAAAAPPPAE
jgi:DNA-binding MarR family transcriptional regulator